MDLSPLRGSSANTRDTEVDVAENVAGAGLEGFVSAETSPMQSTENTNESKRSEICQNGRAEIMSPLL
jgi:hypothetical protein